LNFVLDIIILLILLYFVVSGYARGFSKSLKGLVGTFIAMFASSFLSQPIAEFAYNSVVRRTITTSAEDGLNTYEVPTSTEQLMESLSAVYISTLLPMYNIQRINTGQDVGADSVEEEIMNNLTAEEFVEKLPTYLKDIMPAVGITNEQLKSIFDSDAIGEKNAGEVLAPVYIYIIRTFLFFILYLMFYALFEVVYKLVANTSYFYAFFSSISSVTSSLDISLGHLNSFFGALLGIVEYCVFIMVVLMSLRLTLSVIDNVPEFLSEKSIGQTVVFKEIFYRNPLFSSYAGTKVAEETDKGALIDPDDTDSDAGEELTIKEDENTMQV